MRRVQAVLAYVFVRPTLALVQVICMATHTWGEDQFTLSKGWLWCMLTNNITQVRRVALCSPSQLLTGVGCRSRSLSQAFAGLRRRLASPSRL